MKSCLLVLVAAGVACGLEGDLAIDAGKRLLSAILHYEHEHSGQPR